MEEQAIWTVFLCFWLAVLGAALGSFLDCAVSRWAAGRPPFRGRSRCLACGHTLGAGDLVPVFGYLLRRGRCKYCGEPIPRECLAAELAGALTLGCLAVRFGPAPELGQWTLWAALLLALSLTDQARQLIPDQLLLALLANRAVWFMVLGHGAPQLTAAAKACAVPAALLALVLVLEKCMDREVMGGGDIKLLFVLALYLSWAELLLALLAGCLLGLLRAASAHRRNDAAISFGPFLSAGAVCTVCYGGPVLDWYFGLF